MRLLTKICVAGGAAIGLLLLRCGVELVGLMGRYALLLFELLILFAAIVGVAIVVDAQLEACYARSEGRSIRARVHREKVSSSFLTISPTETFVPRQHTQSSPNELAWQSARREIRLNKHRQSTNYDLRVEGRRIHHGLPLSQEVELGNNTIVIYSGGSWSGLFPNYPRVNQLINFCSCSETSLLAVRVARYLDLPFTIVGFDYPTSRLCSLNIGQTDDSIILSHVYDTVRLAHPKARIMLAGDCLGSLRLLNWIATKPDLTNLSGMMLESPLPSLRHFLNIFTPSDTINHLLFHGLVAILPGYWSKLEKYKSFTAYDTDAFPDIPTFVGMLANDPISNPKDLYKFSERLHKLTVFVSHETDQYGKPVFHGQLVKLPSYQNAVHQFLSQNNILPSKTV